MWFSFSECFFPFFHWPETSTSNTPSSFWPMSTFSIAQYLFGSYYLYWRNGRPFRFGLHDFRHFVPSYSHCSYYRFYWSFDWPFVLISFSWFYHSRCRYRSISTLERKSHYEISSLDFIEARLSRVQYDDGVVSWYRQKLFSPTCCYSPIDFWWRHLTSYPNLHQCSCSVSVELGSWECWRLWCNWTLLSLYARQKNSLYFLLVRQLLKMD